MAEIKILHNPRCSKSRETLKLLEEQGISVEIIEYLKHPLSEAQLRDVFNKLGFTDVTQMMRVKEAEFKQAELHTPDTSDDEHFQAMVSYPKLIERPIVINGSKAKIGRPPESVLEIV